MIAELFYPRELKEIISELESKNDLNDEAKWNLDLFFIRNFIGWSLLGCAVIFLWSLYSYSFLLLIIPFLLKIDGNMHINQKIMPFVHGRKEQLIIFTFWYSIRAKKIVFKDDNGNRYIAPNITDLARSEEQKKEVIVFTVIYPKRTQNYVFQPFLDF